MARYTEKFKRAIIERTKSSDLPSIRAVAKDAGLPIGTVLNWLKKQEGSRTDNADNNLQQTKPVIDNDIQEKFKLLIETANMSAEELGAYCRNKGIYTQDIEVWKQEMLSNLESRNKKYLDKENNALKIELRELKAELRCKDKALAETSALLLLKKKAKIIWGDQEEEK